MENGQLSNVSQAVRVGKGVKVTRAGRAMSPSHKASRGHLHSICSSLEL